MSLAASNVTRTGATLTVSGHGTAWYWRRSPAALGACSSAVPANNSATVDSLTPATAYTFKAYSDASCATELTADSTDAEITTAGLVLSSHGVTVTEGGASAAYTVKLATAPTSDVTVTAAAATGRYPGLSLDTDSVTTGSQSTLTFTTQNWSTAQTVTATVPANSADYTAVLTSIVHSAASTDLVYSGASAANAVRIVDSTAPVLTASSVTATGATLAIANQTAAWYYDALLTLGGRSTCTAVAANTSSVTLSSLSPGTEHSYRAYSDSSCATELTDEGTRARFTTPGVVLSTPKLIAPEGSTAAYSVRLATAPAGSVTVTISKASGGDSDLTVDTDPATAGNQSTLTFTAANWDTPQSVTAAAAAESTTDTAYGTATFNHSATSGYTTTATSALTVTEGDDDVCGGTTAVGNATTGGLVDDCNTLLAAKATLAGTSTAVSNWATSLAIASWTGITTADSRVTGIDVAQPSSPLAGALPNTLGDLDKLTRLDLSTNSLSGPVPPELGSLAELTHLDLRSNLLSGAIPAELGSLSKLEHLDVHGNHLSGPIPAVLGNLAALEHLDFSANLLSGIIPPELGRLGDLLYLDMGINDLWGPIPPQLAGIGATNFAPVHRLVLAHNALSGPIPWQLSRSSPVWLDLSGNALSGAIPTALAGTLSLRRLRLSHNSLSGPLPPQLSNLAGLQELELSRNGFSGPIPRHLSHLAQLGELNLEGNRLSGQIPVELSQLTQLTSLNLAGNRLSGPIPKAFDDLGALLSLSLGGNLLSGGIPAELGSLSELQHLALAQNRLSGPIPVELGSLTGLDSLTLSDNRLSGCVPAGLAGFVSNQRQSDGTTLAVCDGIVLSDAHPSVGEGATATYTVRLSSLPTADVTVAITKTGDSDITLSPASLTFTTANWSTAQTVTLTAAEDDTDTAAGTATITHTASSTDSRYSSLTATATATEADNDTSLSALHGPTSALLEISNHTTAWHYKQTSPTPAGACSMAIAAGTPRAEVTSLTPSTAYTFKAYSDSTCTNANELASVTFTTASGVIPLTKVAMAPEGSQTQFPVVLASDPGETVTVTVSRSSGGDLDLNFDTDSSTNGRQTTISFTSGNTGTWAQPQFVYVDAAEDDDSHDGANQLTLTASTTGATNVYNGATATLWAAELDNDAALTAAAVTATSAVLTLANHSGHWHLGSGDTCTAQGNNHTVTLTGLDATTQYKYKAYSDTECLAELTSDTTDAEFTTENLAVLTPTEMSVTEGASAAYTVSLATAPTADVTLTLAVTGDSDITVSPATLTFTTQNWSTAQTVTVSAAQDLDGANGTAAVTHVATSTDTAYSGKNIGALPITEADDDIGLNATKVTGISATLTLSNHTAAWYYKQTAPTAGTCSAIAAGTSTASLEGLTPGVSYTYKAYSDATCTTELTPDGYGATFATPLATLSTQSLPVLEGSSATYTIKLAAAPTSDVTVTLAVTGDSDITASPATLTFTAQNWSTAQTVTVSAAQDNDRANGTATITHTAASSDTTFSAKSLGTVTVTERDAPPPGTESLSASGITRTGATLTISGHSTAWYYRRSPSTLGPCSSEVAAEATATLTGLMPASTYTFRAYSDSACATELTAGSTDASFTTPGLVLSDYDVTVTEGSSATYSVRLATAPTSDVTVSAAHATSRYPLSVDTDTATSGNQSTLTFTATNWSTPQDVTVAFAANSGDFRATQYVPLTRLTSVVHSAASTDAGYSGASAANAVRIVDSTEPALSASSVTATGATLAIANRTTAWYYRGFARPETWERGTWEDCTLVAANTSSVTLSGLSSGTEYTYHAYSDGLCSAELTRTGTRAQFITPGVMLSPRRLVAPEGSTAEYTVRLATKPAGSVTVTVTKASGDSDLTVDTDTDITGNQNTLTFTAANWDTPQTVTVAAAEENNSDYDYGAAIFNHSATTGYTTTATSSVYVVEADNDVCPGTAAVGGVTVTTGGLVDDCNTLMAAKHILAGTSIAINGWNTATAVNSWTGVTANTSGVTGLSLIERGLNGTIPASLGNLANLTELTLSGNELTGAIPATLGNLTNLNRIYLDRNLLSGPIPATLGNLSKLFSLVLYQNSLSGPIPATLGNANLGWVLLHQNELSGPIPATLGNPADFRRLKLNANALSGPIPATLGNLTLTWLEMGTNALSGSIPATLGNVTNLNTLELHQNSLSGPIPATLGNLTNLEFLQLQGNALSGPIPAELGNLTKLWWLQLQGNALSGPIPAELGNLTDLTRLLLQDNALSGPIPAELGNLAALLYLRLDQNDLSGPIPAALANITDLAWIVLQDNALSGPVPAALSDLAKLSYVWLYYNALSGCMPPVKVSVQLSANPQSGGRSLQDCVQIVLDDAQPGNLGSSGSQAHVRRYEIAEGESSQSYGVRLSAQPSSDVTITLSRVGDADVSFDADNSTPGVQPTLTFTSQNWSTAQLVYLSAAEDADAANGTALIRHTASSSDAAFSSLSMTLNVSEWDNEFALGPAPEEVSATSATLRAATGGSGYVRQTRPALGDCISGTGVSGLAPSTHYVYRAFSDSACSVAAPGVARFTTASGVLVSRESISVPNGESSADSAVIEGSSQTYNVALATAPTADVVLTLSRASGGDSDLTADTDPLTAGDQATLTFTSQNWDTSQTVTFAAAQDADATAGTAAFTLTGASSDPIYHGATATITLTEHDDEVTLTAGAVTATTAILTLANHIGGWYSGSGGTCVGLEGSHTLLLSGLTPGTSYTYKAYSDPSCTTEITTTATDAGFTTLPSSVLRPSAVSVAEGGAASYFTVRLAAAPTSDVTVTVEASGDSDITADTDTSTAGNQSTLTFTSQNWDTSQIVEIAAADDADSAAGTATVSLTAASSDSAYSGISLGSVAVTEIDNDPALTAAPGLAISTAHAAVTEGSATTYSVQLSAAPTSDVTVTVAAATNASGQFAGLSVDTDALAAGDQTTLTFTSQDWSTPQTVTVRVAQNGFRKLSSLGWEALAGIEHTASSADTAYDGQYKAIALTVTDADAPALAASSVTAAGATLTISDWTGAWYYQRHPRQLGECTKVEANTASVTLSGLTAGTEYTFKAYQDSGCSLSQELTGRSRDAEFTTPGVTLSATRLVAPEGGSASYTVRLATRPAGNVTVTVAKASGGDADLTIDTDPGATGDQSTLTFTTANWSTPQSVTVSAAQETGGTDIAYGSATFTHTPSGYTTTTAASLVVTEGDDDVCASTTAVGNAASGGLVDDCNILLAAKAMLVGTATSQLANWGTGLAIDSWTGITAPSTANRVTKIGLGSQMLAGSMPNTLGSLTELKTLSLDSNALGGPVPPELGRLTKLEVLNLEHNTLSGHLPPELGDLGRLKDLWIAHNGLSGPIPAELGSLTELDYLDLRSNALTGPIPSELGSLDLLEQLNLGGNSLTGPIPAELGRLAGLTGLHLNGNALSGPVPAELGRLAELQELRLSRNALSGTIPTELGGLAGLGGLHLNGNALSGPIPAHLGSLTGLQRLYLDSNALSDAMPAQLGNLTGLKDFSAQLNALSGPIPEHLGNLTGLVFLALNDNDLSGPIPAWLGDLAALGELWLGNNSLSGPIPADLGDLAALKELRLNSNDLSGAIPAELGSLSALEELAVSGNSLSGPIPTELGSLTGLDRFRFGRNRLSGCVPANLLAFLSDDVSDTQSDGTTPTVCDGIVLSDAHPSVGENSTATYTVRLSSAPEANVTVALTKSGDSDITVSPASLAFTTTDWSTAQTVTLTAAADNDASAGTATITHTATSTDSDYSSVTATATAAEVDDEPTLSPTGITPTSVVLRITAHAGSWWHKQTSPSSGSCTQVTSSSGTSNETLVLNLTPGTSYTYKAYSDSSCSTELTSDATDAEFTTASGVVVSGSAVVAPENSTGQFSVRLATQPDSSVTVTVAGAASGDTDLTFDTDSVTTGSQSTLSFSTSDWSTPQTVTVAAAADADTAHGTRRLTLTADSSDSVYDDATATVDAVESDDDAVLSAAAVTASAASAAVLTLANHRGSWHLGAGGACTAQGDSHTVDLSGLSPATAYTYKAYSDSSCATELTTNATDAEFTTVGLGVLSATALSVAEGSTATYTVRPSSAPAADVTVTVAVTGDSDITASPATLTFTSQNWSTAQTVTVTAAQDADSANGTATITHNTTSTDPNFSAKNLGAVTVTEADDEVLLTASDVTGTTATLTITNHAGAWHYKQTAPTEGTCSAEIAAGTATASLASLTPGVSYTFRAYSDASCATELTANAADADFATPLAILSRTAATVAEGATATYTIALAAAPAADVTVTVARTGDSDITASPATLTFTSQNWSTTQTVTVTAAQDADSANGTATITHTAASSDAVYSGKNIGTVTVTEADNDATLAAESVTPASATLRISDYVGAWHYRRTSPTPVSPCSAEIAAGTATASLTSLTPGTSYTYKAYSDSACATELTTDATDAEFTTPNLGVLSATALSVTEGTTATYTVTLGAAPSADVTVTVAVTGDSDVTASPATLTFTSQNWSTTQTVTVTAAQDADSANGTATITHNTTSTDPNFSAKNLGAVTVTEADNDATLAAESVTPASATLRISDHAGTWHYKQTLPTGGTCSAEIAAGTATASLTSLTPGTSYTYKAYSDSACATELTTDATDAEFTTPPLGVLSATALSVTEGATATYTVTLGAAPAADVTVTVAVTGDSDITASPATLTFTSQNWSTTQTVTVTAAQDNDGANGTATITHTAASSDAVYSGKNIGTVTVTEADNDVSLTASEVTGTTATLTITNHAGAWHYKQTAPTEGTCSAEIAAGTATASLASLRAGISYTYKAYSDSACATELTTDATDAEFTTPSPPPVGGTPGGVTPGGGGGGGSSRAGSIRLSDATRYGTATAAANKFVTLVEDASAAAGSRQQVDTMIVASGKAFPDALAASALARTLRAPVVLTPPKQLDAAVRAFIARNRITNVVIVGGTEAVSEEVANALSDLTGDDDIERHAGPDRYSTAALIAQAAGRPGSLCGTATPTVIVTTGRNYPDALVAGPLAYRGRHPVVLTEPDRLPAPTAQYLAASGAKQALLVGGTAAVSKTVEDAIKALGLTTTRVSGTDRADTSAKFARRFSALSGPSCYRKDTIGLATGFAFPDALAAAALLGHYGAPLLLTSPKGVPQPLIDYAAAGRLTPDLDQPPIVTIGGRNAVPSNHPTKLLAALPR